MIDLREGHCDVLFVCIGYTGFRMAGDKNFYIDLFDALTEKGLNIIVVSVSDPIEHKIVVNSSLKSYPIIHLRRPFHLVPPQKWWIKNDQFVSYNHTHGKFREYVERYLTLLFWSRSINRVIKKTKPKHIHFLDSFLCPAILLKDATKIVTQPRFEKKAGALYDQYLNILFHKADKGIVFNKKQLENYPERILGKTKFFVQPWGVRSKDYVIDTDARRRFVRNAKNILVLWSGYLQQIGYQDFLYAKKLAEEAIARIPNIEFVFAFKPEVNICLPESSERLSFCKPGKNFIDLMHASDLLFSPLYSRNTIIGPPLTWIEYIASGKPIFTSNVQGLDSYFKKYTSVLSFKDDNECFAIFEDISMGKIDLKEIGQNAYEVYKNHFDLDKIAEKYLEIYQS